VSLFIIGGSGTRGGTAGGLPGGEARSLVFPRLGAGVKRTMARLTYEQLIERFAQWAQGEGNIRAAVVVGSRARICPPADEWADLDIVVVADDPRPYLDEADWVAKLGPYWLTFLEPTADGRSMERRVLFAGGLDVDFPVIPTKAVHEMIHSGAPPPDVADVFRRGAHILLDRDGLVARLRIAATELVPAFPPTEACFLNVVSDFWYHALWTAKHLRRGELWWAKGCCDGHMKGLLCRMLEWHARAVRGPTHDTWFRGRFLEKWADPRAVQELRHTFAHYEKDDVWQALLATMKLFDWLARDTAARLSFPYPESSVEQVTQLVRRLHAARG